MISQKWRGITFQTFCVSGDLGYSALLRRDLSAFFLEVKKGTFLNWSKTSNLQGGDGEIC